MSEPSFLDSCALLAALKELFELSFLEIKQKLDDLIYKEQENQLWKVDMEATMHSIWAKVCYQHASVSVSCQTDEQLEQQCDALQRSFTHLYENSPVLEEEESYIQFSTEVGSQSSCQVEQVSSTHLDETVPCRPTLGNQNSFTLIEKEDRQCISDDGELIDVEVISICSSFDDDSQYTPRKPRTSRKSHSCGKCKAKFSKKSQLTKHERTHNKVICEVCERVFTTRSHLKWHSRFHTGNYPFLCVTCGRSYATKKLMCSHSVCHKRPKYLCTVCGKTYKSRVRLNTHVAIHISEKPFICLICHKIHSDQHTLDLHIQVEHPS